MKARAAATLLIAMTLAFSPGCDDEDDDDVMMIGPPTGTLTVTIQGATAPFDYGGNDPALVDPGFQLEFSHPTADFLIIDLRGVPPLETSPFADSLLVALGGDTTFTRVLEDAQPDTIKYAVTVTIGGQSSTEDPEIIVRPR